MLNIVGESIEKINLHNISTLNIDEIIKNLTQNLISFGGRLVLAIAVFFVGRWIIKKIIKIIKKIFAKKNVEPSLFGFVKSLTSIALNLLLVITVIGILGIETSSFIALFASAGIAIGMALSGTLQNFAGGVMILLFKPFKVGDYIDADGQAGEVKEIQIFNTILATPDNKTIIIPNGGLSTQIMTNFSTANIRRVDWNFCIAYGNNYDKAKSIIEKLITEDKRIKDTPPHLIAILSMNETSINIVVRAWVISGNYWDIYFEMNEKIYKTFQQESISIPFSQVRVNLNTND